MSDWSVARRSDRKYAGLITSPIMSPLSVKALCVVIVGAVTGPIRDWLFYFSRLLLLSSFSTEARACKEMRVCLNHSTARKDLLQLPRKRDTGDQRLSMHLPTR